MAERRTPLYDIDLRTAARMVKGGGDYLFPWAYTAPAEEHLNVRRNVGNAGFDQHGRGGCQGAGGRTAAVAAGRRQICDLLPGQVRYTTLCRERMGGSSTM